MNLISCRISDIKKKKQSIRPGVISGPSLMKLPSFCECSTRLVQSAAPALFHLQFLIRETAKRRSKRLRPYLPLPLLSNLVAKDLFNFFSLKIAEKGI